MTRTPLVLTLAVFFLTTGCAGMGGDDPESGEVAEEVLSCCAPSDNCVGQCVQSCILGGETASTCKNECQGDCGCRVCGTGTPPPPPPTCPAGQSLCMDGCSNLDTSTDCGSCSHTCAPSFSCSAQVCQTFIQEGCSGATCCVKQLGECTGVLGGTKCIFNGTQRSCATGGPLWGEAPWFQLCTQPGPGGLPVHTVQAGFDVCF